MSNLLSRKQKIESTRVSPQHVSDGFVTHSYNHSILPRPPPFVRPPALKNTHPFIGSCSTYWGHCCRKPNTRNCTITHAPMLAPRRGHGVFPLFFGVTPHRSISVRTPYILPHTPRTRHSYDEFLVSRRSCNPMLALRRGHEVVFFRGRPRRLVFAHTQTRA